jgi:hypothetical protein
MPLFLPPSAGGGYATVQEEGVALAARSVLDFRGPGVLASDDSAGARSRVTVNGPFDPPILSADQISPVALPGATNWATVNQCRFGRVYLVAGEVYSGFKYRQMVLGSGSTIRMGVFQANGPSGAPQAKIAATEVVWTPTGTGNVTRLMGSKDTAITWARSGFLVTVTSVPHALNNGDSVTISGTGVVDGTWTVGSVTATTWTFTHGTSGTASGSGRQTFAGTGNWTVPTSDFYWLAFAIDGGTSEVFRISAVPLSQRDGGGGSGFPTGGSCSFQDFAWFGNAILRANASAGQSSAPSADLPGIGIVRP